MTQSATMSPGRGQGTCSDMALSRLIRPMSVETFLGTVREQTWLHACPVGESNGSGRFDHLVSVADLDHLLTVVHAAGLGNTDAVRVSRGGEPVPAWEWLRQRPDGYTELDVRRLLSLHRNGATIVLNGLQRCIGPVDQLCGDLAAFFGVQVLANAYLTPAGGQGFPPHPDNHDVFLLQIAGSKRWRLYDSPVPLTLTEPDRPHRPTAPPQHELVLRTGDVLYIPRGLVHEGLAMPEDASVHLTLGVHPYTWAQLIIDLVAELREDDEHFRRSVAPRLGDVDSDDGLEATLSDLLGRLCDPMRVRQLRQRRAARSLQPGRTGLQGRLADLLRPPTIDSHTPLQPVEPDAELLRSGDEVILTTSEKMLTFPAFVEPHLDALLTGRATCAAELGSGLDPAGRLTLVRRLVREGVLELRR